MTTARALVASLLVLAAHPAGASAQRPRVGALCPDPARPCAGFSAGDLSFVLPRDGVARAESRSSSFWAVILRSADACGIGEPERRRTQARFPHRKVFVHRFECGAEANVTYDGVNRRHAFLAVYAGATRDSATALLDSVRRGGAFPGANVRRMHVVLVHP